MFFRMLSPATRTNTELFMQPPRPRARASSSSGSRRQQLPQVRRGVVPILHRLVALDASVSHFDDALRVLRDVRLVRHEHDRDALFVQLLKERHDLDRHVAVEISRRLVGEQQRRLGDERSRDRHALLLPARQLARLVIQTIAESHASQRFRGELPSCPFQRPVAIVQQRQLDVVERRRPCQQIESLEDEAELLIAQVGELDCGSAHRPACRRASTSPDVGVSRQPSMFMSVDLPEPDAPMIAIISPRSALRSTPRSAWTTLSPIV